MMQERIADADKEDLFAAEYRNGYNDGYKDGVCATLEVFREMLKAGGKEDGSDNI